jgi:hypothetical protein
MRAQLAQRRIVRLQQLDEQLAACLTLSEASPVRCRLQGAAG